MTLTPEHRAKLEAAAISPAVIEAAGLYSVTSVDELPEEFRWYGEAAVPSIVFPWRSPTGAVVLQLKPDVPVTLDGDEKPRKYLLARGAPSVFDAAVPDGDTVLLCEGTKQHLAAASYAPAKTAVFGLMGCSQWMDDNVPIPDLYVVEDKPVIVSFDADLRTNPDVWSMADGLVDAARAQGATEVRFVKLPGGRDAGLDDVLAVVAPERRRDYLARLLAGAVAKLPPKPRGRAAKARKIPPAGGRKKIIVNDDPWLVINDVTDVLVDRLGGSRLFDHGGVISKREGPIITPLERGAFLDVLQEVALCVSLDADGNEYPSWPDPNSLLAVLSRAGRYAPLHRVSRVPFVRPDGSVCQVAGYDEETGTFLIWDDPIGVPESPTAEQVSAAVALILDDWLGDMPFETAADRANALAFILTPPIRGLVDIVPMAVIDGLQMGVGKNLMADCISIAMTGAPIDPVPYTTDQEELRKVITALFRRGTDFFFFDEAHELHGNTLARSLTAASYIDRVLGVSQMAQFPNRATWASLGNQVQVGGDVVRRVYRISLRPTGADPHDRGPECFAHHDLKAWTRDHRTALLEAILTIVRAWFAAGSPPSSRGAAFGSFERWGRMLGGILEHAGVSDFLSNMAEWRSETDLETAYWVAHYYWLRDTFGDREFRAAAVRRALMADTENAEPPPGMEDLSGQDYVRELGKRYARMRDRVLDGKLRLVRDSVDAKKKVTLWRIEGPDDTGGITDRGGDGDSGGGDHEKAGMAGMAGMASPPCIREKLFSDAKTRAPVYRGLGDTRHTRHTRQPDLLPFDLETADADALWTYGSDYVRLVGYRGRSGEIHTGTDPGVVLRAVAKGLTLTGHNVWGFDLLALARHHGLDPDTVPAIDTKILAALADPPPARMKPEEAERYYSLDSLGQRLLGSGKTGDLKALAKRHGGYDRIPVDDPEYLTYVRGDVDLTARLAEHYGPLDGYAIREHDVARLAARITMNGFRVDVDLLNERIAAGERRREELLADLEHLDLPKTTKDGKHPCKAPLATEKGRETLEREFTRLGVRLPRTASGGPSLGSETMQAIIDGSPGTRAAELAEAVLALNGIRTIYENISACLAGDRVHPSISFRQATGRWSVTRPGLTVVGKRNGRHVEREVFLPEEGHVVIAADLAQVDARAVAVHSQDPAYIALMAPGLDLHAEIARMVWNDPSRRESAKPLSHGFNYGVGLQTVADTAGVPFEEAGAFLARMKEQFPLVVEWQRRTRDQAAAGLLLDNGFGRQMRPTLDRGHTQAPGLVGQGCARDLMMEGLLRLPREVWPYLRGVIHDEAVLSVPIDIVDDVERSVIEALSFDWAPDGAEIPVAVVAELGKRRGRNWGDVYRKGAP